jgi:hypothetical protein
LILKCLRIFKIVLKNGEGILSLTKWMMRNKN